MFNIRKSTAVIFASAVALSVSVAHGGELRSTVVKTHPSQGDVAIIVDAGAHLQANDNGIFVNFDTSGLTPGHVHTLWLVAINNPAACESAPCTSKDALKRTDIVKADVGYAGGMIVSENGAGNFTAYQPIGTLAGAWFADGLQSTDQVEIHLVVNDHGPVIEGQAADMLSTYRGGCTDASIPGPMPASARAQGMPGPNQCRLVQFSIFQPDGAQS
jgi:hypothetical protein